MIHNGIEYGLMQAYAEGFDILKNAASEELPEEQRYAFDLPDIAEVWRRGTSSPPGCSTLPQWRSRRIKISPRTRVLYRIPARAAGRSWRPSRKPCRPTFLSAALYARFRSRQEHTFAEKMLSAMRKGFDGHVEPPVGG
jgi:6-phosphogluconate dehydrogenase